MAWSCDWTQLKVQCFLVLVQYEQAWILIPAVAAAHMPLS